MNEKELLQLIEKYKKNNCSPEEREIVEGYLTSFQISNSVWDESTLGNQNVMRQKIYSNIKKNIFDLSFPKTHKLGYLLKIAASIALLIVLSYSIYQLISPDNAKDILTVKWNEEVTSLGEKRIITLLDGTKITLNAGSKVKYETSANSSKREFYLEGEAYFEVAPNPNEPFTVHSKKVSTRVIGTKFDFKAFPNEKEIVVSLVEGSVKVVLENNKEKTLLPNQQARYSVVSKNLKLNTFNKREVLGWRENILIFNNTEIENVLAQIERAYAVEMDIADESIKKLRIKADFENESFWTIIKVLKAATRLDYTTFTRNDSLKKIKIYKK